MASTECPLSCCPSLILSATLLRFCTCKHSTRSEKPFQARASEACDAGTADLPTRSPVESRAAQLALAGARGSSNNSRSESAGARTVRAHPPPHSLQSLLSCARPRDPAPLSSRACGRDQASCAPLMFGGSII
eukprot:5537414-Pleurochrysis_carterae.AAC.2